MKTPMMELIEQLKAIHDCRANVSIEASLPIHTVVMLAESMLEKEKEMLAGVWLDAQVAYQGDAYIKPSDPTFDEYYEATFNTKEK